MTDSLYRVGVPTRSTDSLTRSYVRTYERTNEEPLSPKRDNSPYVTRVRAYGFAEVTR
jgi:hypothetical protein